MSFSKAQELSDIRSCLNKAAPDEPIFVLRGNDPHAAQTIRLWAAMTMGSQTDEVREEACRIADAFDAHYNKLPKSCTPGDFKIGQINSTSHPLHLNKQR